MLQDAVEWVVSTSTSTSSPPRTVIVINLIIITIIIYRRHPRRCNISNNPLSGPPVTGRFCHGEGEMIGTTTIPYEPTPPSSLWRKSEMGNGGKNSSIDATKTFGGRLLRFIWRETMALHVDRMYRMVRRRIIVSIVDSSWERFGGMTTTRLQHQQLLLLLLPTTPTMPMPMLWGQPSTVTSFIIVYWMQV